MWAVQCHHCLVGCRVWAQTFFHALYLFVLRPDPASLSFVSCCSAIFYLSAVFIFVKELCVTQKWRGKICERHDSRSDNHYMILSHEQQTARRKDRRRSERTTDRLIDRASDRPMSKLIRPTSHSQGAVLGKGSAKCWCCCKSPEEHFDCGYKIFHCRFGFWVLYLTFFSWAKNQCIPCTSVFRSSASPSPHSYPSTFWFIFAIYAADVFAMATL